MFELIKKHIDNKLNKKISTEEINAIVLEADCYYFGKNGCSVDKSKAYSLFEIAAKNGHIYAQLMLGYMYDYGDTVSPNVNKAVEWYKKASDAGNENATLNLANIYLLGRNTEVDKYKGIALLKKAADQGSPIAASSLAREYTIGDVLGKSINDAVLWASKAEDKGYINCHTVTNIGLMFDEIKDYTKAFKYFEKAIKTDPEDLNAQYLYAQYKFYGKGTDCDLIDAKKRLEWVVSVDPNDNDAKTLLSIATLKETLICACDFTVPVIKNDYYVWNYMLDVFVGSWGFKVNLYFEGNKYNDSVYWKRIMSHFKLSEKQPKDNYSIELFSDVYLQNKREYNINIARSVFESVIKEYPHIKFFDMEEYFTTKWLCDF